MTGYRRCDATSQWHNIVLPVISMHSAQPLAAQVLAYDPDVLVIGGGLSDIDEIFQALPAAIGRHLFSGVTVPPVRRAEYGAASGERGAAILGARLAG